MSGRACLLTAFALWAVTLASGCDDFEPAFAVGGDGRGGPAVYPVTCSPDEVIVQASVEDTGATNYNRIPEDSVRVLWEVRSESGYPGHAGLQPSSAAVTDTVVPWTEELGSLPAAEYLRIRVDLRIHGKIHGYEDEFQVSEIDLRPDTVSARFYGAIPLEEFQTDVVPRACHVDRGLMGDWLADRPHWLRTAFAISTLFWLPALGGVLWGAIVVGKRHRPPGPPASTG